MFRFLYYTKIIFLLFSFVACSNNYNESKYKTNSEILSYAIKDITNEELSDGKYIFICGPCCIGCVQQTLFKLDSLYYIFHQIKDYKLITSHEFVKNWNFKNLTFFLFEKFDEVNYDFSEVMIIKLYNDSIVYSKELNNINIDSFHNW